MSLDSCINLFITANNGTLRYNDIVMRDKNDFPSFSFLKGCVNDNVVLKKDYKSTKTLSENNKDIPNYLSMFFDEFFTVEDVDMNNLDNEIIMAIEKVESSYPYLTNDELDGLFFVAGITYNSCEYWYEKSDKWTELLCRKKPTNSNWLWTGVKNGVKKMG